MTAPPEDGSAPGDDSRGTQSAEHDSQSRRRVVKTINVHRTKKTKASRYTCIDNAVLQHEGLSLLAIGLLSYVLSKPITFKHSARSIAGRLFEGEDTATRALRELQKSGHARLLKIRDANGRFQMVWKFYEAPTASDLPEPVKPGPVKRGPAEPGPVQPGAVKQHFNTESTDEESTVVESKEGETTGGRNRKAETNAPPELVRIPYASWKDVPEATRNAITHEWLEADDGIGECEGPKPLHPAFWEKQFDQIHTRKLMHRDTYTAAEWPKVIAGEMTTALERLSRESSAIVARKDLWKLPKMIRAGGDEPTDHGHIAPVEHEDPGAPF